MNYVWEVLLAADKGKADRRGPGRKDTDIRFLPAKHPSPYVEVSFAELNTVTLENPEIEVNPLYRFGDIFADIFSPDLREYGQTRQIFLDVVMHYMAEADLLSGMHRQEYCYWFLSQELMEGVFGSKAAEAFQLFDAGERRIIAVSLLGLYRSSHYMELFAGVIRTLYENAIIYEGQDNAETVYLYLGRRETAEERKRARFLADTFLPLHTDIRIFYDRHFGIIDTEETMKLDKILLM